MTPIERVKVNDKEGRLRQAIVRLHLGVTPEAFVAGDMDTKCNDPECPYCAVICCPFADEMHFHHDGCPSCFEAEAETQNGNPS